MSLGKINAMANISKQTETQRNEFADGDGILGANRTSHLLFAEKLQIDENDGGAITIDGEQINSKAESELTSLYVSGASGNPDFPLNHLGSNYKYEGAIGMLESASAQSDKPNMLGPNLIPPKINDDGEVDTSESQNTATSPVSGRGFGVNLDRHNPNGFESLGSYLKRRRDENDDIDIPKGEFVNEDKYDWEA